MSGVVNINTPMIALRQTEHSNRPEFAQRVSGAVPSMPTIGSTTHRAPGSPEATCGRRRDAEDIGVKDEQKGAEPQKRHEAKSPQP